MARIAGVDLPREKRVEILAHVLEILLTMRLRESVQSLMRHRL